MIDGWLLLSFMSIVIDDCSSLALQKEGPFFQLQLICSAAVEDADECGGCGGDPAFFRCSFWMQGVLEMDFIQWMLRWVYWVQVKWWQSKQCFTCFTWFQNCWSLWQVWKCKTSERVEVEQKENLKDDLTLAFPEIEGFQPLNVRGPGWTEICHSWTCELLRFDPEVILALNNIGKAIGAAWRGAVESLGRWLSLPLTWTERWSEVSPGFIRAVRLVRLFRIFKRLNFKGFWIWLRGWWLATHPVMISDESAGMHNKYGMGYGMIYGWNFPYICLSMPCLPRLGRYSTGLKMMMVALSIMAGSLHGISSNRGHTKMDLAHRINRFHEWFGK